MLANRYDVSLLLENFPSVIHATRDRLRSHGLLGSATDTSKAAEVVCWGHLGDGNLHINVVIRGSVLWQPLPSMSALNRILSFHHFFASQVCGVASDAVESCLEPWLFEWVALHGGSISAEVS